ncbi:hypothetical protein ACH5RR_005297 [Cinchona calisaya]|uniref:Mitochondrial glycoprotein family protein n=1 Tax=Cinchona calisaya TaxID=153742 RepID=A0ABD3AKU7_9GENT
MSLYSLFRSASTTGRSATPWRCSSAAAAKIVENNRTPLLFQGSSVTPIRRLCTAASSPTVKKKKKFKRKQQQQNFQLVDQYHSSHLIRILDSEIKCALDSDLLHCAVDVPDGFPFKVLDIVGGRKIVLEREFQGETIRVLVDMPTSTTVDDETQTESSIPVVVSVSKGNGSCLQFDGRVFPGRILVNGLLLDNSCNSEEDGRFPYRGPDFLDLNENFRKAIYDYLEIRGLTSSTANYLIEYMISKDAKEYLGWLKSLKELIEQ